MASELPRAMKAVVLEAYGGPENLRLAELPVPAPSKGEVLVRMAAAPINPSDLIFFAGRNPLPRPLPAIAGFEGAGVVVAAGASPRARALLGRPVALRANPAKGGTWAEYSLTDADRCLRLHHGTKLAEAASFLVNPLTAWGLLHAAKAGGHRAAVQTAAASALGRMLIRLAKERRYPLINVVRSAESAARLRALGAGTVLDSSAPSFDAELRGLALSMRATVAFEAVGGETAARVLRALPPRSELWCYGGLSGQPCPADPVSLIYEQKSVRGFWGPPYVAGLGPATLAKAGSEIERKLATVFKTEVGRERGLEDFAAAIAEYGRDMSAGKQLFVMGRR